MSLMASARGTRFGVTMLLLLACSSDDGTPGDTSSSSPGSPDGPSSLRLVALQSDASAPGRGMYVYTPPGHPGEGGWPLLITQHGIGEAGDGAAELPKLLETGIPELIATDAWPEDRPFVVIMPQYAGFTCVNADGLDELIDWAIETYAVDSRRVYLTGLSCGAAGGWTYLGEHLDSQIAAFVPIAGFSGGAWDKAACDLTKVPIWAFHGDADPTVGLAGSTEIMDQLATCPSPPAQPNTMTIYPDVEHNSWDQTYDGSAGHDIYAWMLSFERP